VISTEAGADRLPETLPFLSCGEKVFLFIGGGDRLAAKRAKNNGRIDCWSASYVLVENEKPFYSRVT
jgi:hypothetical protein